jgi:hypothetical protein
MMEATPIPSSETLMELEVKPLKWCWTEALLHCNVRKHKTESQASGQRWTILSRKERTNERHN